MGETLQHIFLIALNTFFVRRTDAVLESILYTFFTITKGTLMSGQSDLDALFGASFECLHEHIGIISLVWAERSYLANAPGL